MSHKWSAPPCALWAELLLGPARARGCSPAGPLLVPLVLCAGPACPGLGGWARRALLSVSLCPQQGTVKAKGNSCLWKQPKSYGGNSWWGFQRSGWHRFRASQYFSFCRWDLLGFVSPFLGSQENACTWSGLVLLLTQVGWPERVYC